LEITQIRTTKQVTLSKPILLDFSAEAESPISIIAQTLLQDLKAEKIAEVYSPYLPDYAVAEETGLCHLPRLDIYAVSNVAPNLLIITGEEDLDPDDFRAHYEFAEAILDYSTKMGCQRLITGTAIRSRRAQERIYVAATTSSEAAKTAEKFGGKPFSLGRINIPTGPLIGMAKIRGYRVLCIIATLDEQTKFEEITSLLYDYIIRVFGPKTERK
jgi:proteasome assembly chaperone (PAC2) family protein